LAGVQRTQALPSGVGFSRGDTELR